jgi:hypothetical protein
LWFTPLADELEIEGSVFRASIRSTELADFVLPFLDLLSPFNSADHNGRSPKALQSEHRIKPLFDSPMVVFDRVYSGTCCCGPPLQRDLRWHPLPFYGLAQKSLGCVDITIPA